MKTSLMRRVAILVALAVGLASCATPPPPPPPPKPKPKPPPPPPPPPPKVIKKPKPKLNVVSECKFRNVTGYNGRAKLHLAESKVQHFEARVNIPRRGRCNFRHKDFRQVRHQPHVELSSKKGCTVRMWQQGRQLTVAFADCKRHCSGNAADYLWPILVDKPTGKCD